MDTLAVLVVLAGGAGAWLVMMSFILHTSNLRSALFFKVIPFFLGAANLLAVGKLLGAL